MQTWQPCWLTWSKYWKREALIWNRRFCDVTRSQCSYVLGSSQQNNIELVVPWCPSQAEYRRTAALPVAVSGALLLERVC
jgi:hypothetical protein